MRRHLVPVQALSALGLCLALLTAACGDDDQQASTGDDTSSTSSSTSSTTTPGDESDDGGTDGTDPVPTEDGLVITLDSHGGFVPVESNAGNTAELVLLGDGRLISGAPMTMIYPGPAMPPFQVSTIGAADIAEVVAAIEALDPDADYSQNSVADAPDTTVTLRDGDRSVSITGNALGMVDDRGPRAELQAVVERLQSLPTGNGEQQYTPTALRVHDITPLVGDAPEPTEGEPQGIVRPWPIPHDGAVCTVITDAAQVTKVLDVLRQATQLDRFATDAGERRLVVAPFLPGDPGCPDS